jgi:RNA polymerase sigma factor (sigma-70 family)
VDPETVQKARRGDAGAVEALARALTPELWRLAVHLSGDRALAEDLVTEALYRGIAKLRRLRKETAVGGWFRKILVHRWRDWLRRNREAPVLLEAGVEPAAPESTDPVLQAESTEAFELVAAEIAQLPPGQRAVLALRLDGVLSPTEIAKVLGTKADRVKANLWHGRRRLRERLPGLFGAD